MFKDDQNKCKVVCGNTSLPGIMDREPSLNLPGGQPLWGGDRQAITQDSSAPWLRARIIPDTLIPVHAVVIGIMAKSDRDSLDGEYR